MKALTAWMFAERLARRARRIARAVSLMMECRSHHVSVCGASRQRGAYVPGEDVL